MIEPGTHLRLIDMPSDPAPLPPGATCVVMEHVGEGSGFEQLWVKWDAPNDHRSLNLLPGYDIFEVIE